MKNIYKISLFSILSILLLSCSERIMDDINRNQNNPSDVTSRFIITDAIVSSAFNVTGTDFNFYASVYIEHNVGIYNQMYQAEIRQGTPTSSSTFNNVWGSTYTNLLNLSVAIEKCSKGGEEDGNYTALGVAQVLSAYNLAMLTDLMGDIPWKEALQPGVIYTPKMTTQQEIYADIVKFLDDGIENLAKKPVSGMEDLGPQDLLFSGDVKLWTKLAYALKARYAMRLSLKNPQYDKVLEYANQSFESQEEEAAFYYNGASSNNPNYMFFMDRDYFGSSKSLHEKLVARDDPRDEKYFTPYPEEEVMNFAPNGTPHQVQEYYAISALLAPKKPTYLFSFHELEFLKAEAYARKGNTSEAKTALRSALRSTFVNTGLRERDADNYLNNISDRFDKNPLEEIMIQKYLAFYDNESIEAYNDYRRLKAMGNNFIQLSNPKNSKLFPLRFTYGSSDVTTNPNVEKAYGDGTYVYTENVWWAGGTR